MCISGIKVMTKCLVINHNLTRLIVLIGDFKHISCNFHVLEVCESLEDGLTQYLKRNKPTWEIHTKALELIELHYPEFFI